MIDFHLKSRAYYYLDGSRKAEDQDWKGVRMKLLLAEKVKQN